MLVFIAGALVGAALLAVLLWKSVTKPMIERQLGALVSKVGPSALAGSKVDLERVEFALGSKAGINLVGLKIHNLDPYVSESLLRIGNVGVAVDLSTAVNSRGKRIVVLSMNLNDCRLTVEKNLDITTSNVQELMKKLKDSKGDEKPQEKPEEKPAEKPQQKPEDKENATKVVLRKIDITGVQVEGTTTLQVQKSLPGVVLPVPGIVFDDFSATFGEDLSPAQVIQKVLDKIVSEATSKLSSATEKLAAATDKAAEVAQNTSSWLSSSVAGFFSPSSKSSK